MLDLIVGRRMASMNASAIMNAAYGQVDTFLIQGHIQGQPPPLRLGEEEKIILVLKSHMWTIKIAYKKLPRYFLCNSIPFNPINCIHSLNNK